MALTDNLLHYWDLTDDGTWADSVGSWSLTETGTPDVSGTQPKGSGSCLDVDSGDYLDRTSVAWDGGGAARSYAIWAKMDSISATYGNWLINHRGATGSDTIGQITFRNEATDQIQANLGDGTTQADIIATTVPVTGTWYFIVITTNGTNSHKIYVDGTLETTDTTTLDGTVDAAAAPFAIGAAAWDKTESTLKHIGQCFAAGIWDREISAAEITSLYSGGDGLTYAQLTGHTAALAPLAATFAVVAQTAVADAFDAALSPLTATFALVATTATATEIAAAVDPVVATFALTATTPTWVAPVNAAVSPLAVSWTIPAVTAQSGGLLLFERNTRGIARGILTGSI